MRTLKIVTIVMAVMIVAAVIFLGMTIMRRMSEPPGGMASAANVVLDEPTGSRIVAFTSSPDRLVIQLQGGGPDRILFVDPRSGKPLGRVVLAQ